MRKIPDNRKSPIKMHDWTALDQDLDEFLKEKSLGEHTRRAHDRLWRWWVQFVAGLGEGLPVPLDPWDAPWWVWEELVLARKADGSRYSADRPTSVLNVVGRRYSEGGLAAPLPKRSQHAADWKLLIQGNKRTSRSEAPASAKTPMTRDHLLAILRAPIDQMPGKGRAGQYRGHTSVAVLLSLDLEFTSRRISRLRIDDVTRHGERDLTVDGSDLRCDHTERARGVPWDCAACELWMFVDRRRAQGAAGTDRLMGAFSEQGLDYALRSTRHRWRHLDAAPPTPSLRFAEGSTAYERAGTRRGLLLWARHPRSEWLVARAWTCVAWAGGFRMVGDLARLPRHHVALTSEGDGFVLRLSTTKDDPAGREPVSRPYLFDGPWDLAARALAEYLCVRDAFHGTDGLLFCLPRNTTPERASRRLATAGEVTTMLNRVAVAAGLPLRFTSYSTRRGYVRQGAADGRDLELLQAGVRHRKPETTHRHYREVDARRSSTKFMQRATDAAGGDGTT